MSTRNIIIAVVAIGVVGSCLVGSCLVWAVAAADESSTDEQAVVTPAPDAPEAQAPHAPGTVFQCQAMGTVNKCVAPGQCMFHSVSGFGSGENRMQAAEMARLACNGQAIAMGGSTICAVTCTP